jgi:predicted acetyltransferase
MTFQAGEVLEQLGGNKFIAMTGAKNFIKDDTKQMICFNIGRNSANVNGVRIVLNSMDTYDMEFLSVRAGNIKIKSEAKGIYWDMLQEIFTEHTGMYTHL